jgi:hypothetical protein
MQTINSKRSRPPIDPFSTNTDIVEDETDCIIVTPAKESHLKLEHNKFKDNINVELHKIKLVLLGYYAPNEGTIESTLVLLANLKPSLISGSQLSEDGKLKSYLSDRMQKDCSHLPGSVFEPSCHMRNSFTKYMYYNY